MEVYKKVERTEYGTVFVMEDSNMKSIDDAFIDIESEEPACFDGKELKYCMSGNGDKKYCIGKQPLGNACYHIRYENNIQVCNYYNNIKDEKK